jgi:hypothetical protein
MTQDVIETGDAEVAQPGWLGSIDDDERFYSACAEMLGAGHAWRDAKPHPKVDRVTGAIWQPMTRAGRWAGREPGNGRFEGFGLIRLFGQNRVHLLLRRPQAVNRIFDGRGKALEFLARICTPV